MYALNAAFWCVFSWQEGITKLIEILPVKLIARLPYMEWIIDNYYKKHQLSHVEGFDPNMVHYKSIYKNIRYDQIPQRIDWNKHGFVRDVCNQHCDDCYCFAAVAAIESLIQIRARKVI